MATEAPMRAPLSRPRLIILCGNAGVGKSTIAQRLARSTRSCLIDIDDCTDRLVRAGLLGAGRNPDDRDSPWFKEHFRLPIIDTLFDIAADQLALGLSALVVAPLTAERKSPEMFARLLRAIEERLIVRLRRRSGAAAGSDSSTDDFTAAAAVVVCHVVVCCCSSFDERLRRIQQRAVSRDSEKFADVNAYRLATETHDADVALGARLEPAWRESAAPPSTADAPSSLLSLGRIVTVDTVSTPLDAYATDLVALFTTPETTSPVPFCGIDEGAGPSQH